MDTEKKLTTLGQMRTLAQQQDARDDEQDEQIKNHTHNANQVKFSDGETFQAKYDSGKLTGPKGEKGDTGAQGPKGDTGAAGTQGPKGDTGATGSQGPKGDTGTRGSMMYWGTGVTGTSTTAAVFSSSGVSSALVNDLYLNTSTWNVYQCTTAGAASAAKWKYVGNIKGAKGATGNTGATGKTAYQYAQDGGYTGTETEFAARMAEDYALSSDVLNIASFGTVIPSAEDLNNYTTPGNYYSENSAKSKTLLNCPITTSGFRLIVIKGYSSVTTTQLIFGYGNTFWFRAYQSTTQDWAEWISVLRDTTYSDATTSKSGLMSAADKSKSDATNVAYGTCSTADATAAKVVTISGNTNWKLAVGSVIFVKFTNTNTASNPTFNVGGTGAKPVWYNTAVITTSSLSYAGYAGRTAMYVYDGTQFVFQGWPLDSNTTYSNASLGQGYGTCSTAAATTAKVVTLSSYSLITGGIVAVKFTYDVPASATMNINSKGAKSIYYRGAAIKAGIIKAGDVATFIYNGSQYHLLAIDRVACAVSITNEQIDAILAT